MDGILNFIFTNYKLIIDGVLLIVAVILFILRKKPINLIDGISNYIYDNAPRIINKVEAMAKGSKYIDYDGKVTPKIDVAISLMVKELSVFFPANDVTLFTYFIRTVIENILSTPQKKGVKDGEKKTHD